MRACGMGAECASVAEVEQALRQGVPAENIIYDSPAKTTGDISRALELGVLMNLDNFSEVKKTSKVIRAGLNSKSSVGIPKPRVGIRINPQMESGSIQETSTATATSKFGIALRDHEQDLIKAYAENPWLNAMHVHVGSQGCPLTLSARGAATVFEFAKKINKAVVGRAQIQHFDIGGGVPSDYDADGESRQYRFSDYASALEAEGGGVLSAEQEGMALYTEMGRSLVSKAGWTASRVEAVKEAGGRRIVIVHVGADLFVRTAYQPHNWPHRISVFTPDGDPKTGIEADQDVVGPLCFTGDAIATQRSLPLIEEGDIVVVHDTGAYTYAMYSRYNSRLAPPVYGYDDAEEINFSVVKARETVDQVLSFWG